MSKSKKHSFDKKKAVLYVRVSTHWQVDKDSLPVQRRELESYCRYVLGIDDFVIMEDAGYSAKNTDRPAYQEMMTRIRSGEFSHLLVWKLDRISRNLLDFMSMYTELKDLGVVFVSKNEQFDTGTAMGEAMLKLAMVFAELERNTTSERVTSVMLSRANTGAWNGGRIPYGYALTPEKSFAIVENEAEVVRRIFDEYADGASILSITRDLNEDGIKTRRGYDWSPTTVWIILDNPVYCGTLRYNLRNEHKGSKDWSFREDKDIVYTEDHHPPIVSKEQYARCHEILERRNSKKRGAVRTYRRKHVHVFQGLLTCGECGSPMTSTIGTARADGWRPSIYMCSRRRLSNDCKNKYISDATIGPFVLNYLANMLKTYKAFGETTSPETLEKKLLRGPAMRGVIGIERDGLMETYRAFKEHGNLPDVFFLKSMEDGDADATSNERDLLLANKARLERALNRLKAVYLYNDSGMSEVEYTVERKKLMDDLNKTDERLSHLASLENSSMLGGSNWMEQASYFVMTQELMSKRQVSYKSLLAALEPEIVRDFVLATVQNFCILDGKIASITFKSGITHRFLYKSAE